MSSPNGSVHRFGAMPRNPHECRSHPKLVDYGQAPALAREDIAFVRDAYDECVADLDEQLGRLLDELGRRGVLERTWLIVTSDHGESFGEQPGVLRARDEPLSAAAPRPAGDRPAVGQPEAIAAGRPRDREPPRPAGDDRRPAGPRGSVHRFPAHRWCRSGPAPPRRPSPSPQAGVRRSPRLSRSIPWTRNPAQLLDRRRAWASLAEGDWIYIRREGSDLDELFDLRSDARESDNRAGDPAVQPVIEQMRQRLDKMTEGPLTHQRFNP